MTVAPLEVDVAVIGGGLTGVATAVHLAEAGVSVALLERGTIGWPAAGATAAAATGLLCTGAADHAARAVHGIGRRAAAEVVRFTEENRAIIEALVARHRIDCGLARRGSYAVASNESELHDLQETAALCAEERIAAGSQLLTAEALASRAGAPRGLGAIFYPADAELDPAALVRALAAALRAGACGPGAAHVLEGARVRSLEAGGGGGVRIALEGRGGARARAGAPDARVALEGALEGSAAEVRASIAVVAANGWACEVHPFFERRVFPTRGQGFVTAPLPPLLDAPVHAGWGHEVYRQRADGRLVACGFRPDPGPEDTGFDAEPTEAFQGFLARFAALRIPGLAAPEGAVLEGEPPSRPSRLKAPSDNVPRGTDPPSLLVERRFAATCGFSSDGLPLLGPLPGQPEVIAACGFTMRGLSFGAAAGRAVARLIVDGARTFPACLAAARML